MALKNNEGKTIASQYRQIKDHYKRLKEFITALNQWKFSLERNEREI